MWKSSAGRRSRKGSGSMRRHIGIIAGGRQLVRRRYPPPCAARSPTRPCRLGPGRYRRRGPRRPPSSALAPSGSGSAPAYGGGGGPEGASSAPSSGPSSVLVWAIVGAVVARFLRRCRQSRGPLRGLGVARRGLARGRGLMGALRRASWASALGLLAGATARATAGTATALARPRLPAAIGPSGKTAAKRSRITPAPHRGPRGDAHAPISLV